MNTQTRERGSYDQPQEGPKMKSITETQKQYFRVIGEHSSVISNVLSYLVREGENSGWPDDALRTLSRFGRCMDDMGEALENLRDRLMDLATSADVPIDAAE
jgi:hypothetical protein